MEKSSSKAIDIFYACRRCTSLVGSDYSTDAACASLPVSSLVKQQRGEPLDPASAGRSILLDPENLVNNFFSAFRRTPLTGTVSPPRPVRAVAARGGFYSPHPTLSTSFFCLAAEPADRAVPLLLPFRATAARGGF
jgi:hypothetical protein